MKNEVIYVVLVYALLNTLLLSATFNKNKEVEVLEPKKIAIIEATVVNDEVVWEFNVNENYYENECAFSIGLIKAAKEYCEK